MVGIQWIGLLTNRQPSQKMARSPKQNSWGSFCDTKMFLIIREITKFKKSDDNKYTQSLNLCRICSRWCCRGQVTTRVEESLLDSSLPVPPSVLLPLMLLGKVNWCFSTERENCQHYSLHNVVFPSIQYDWMMFLE